MLLSIWVLSPLPLYFSPSFFGLLTPAADWSGVVHNVGWVWLWLALGGLLFRVGQLCIQQSVQTGLVWATKILTDPFHDIKLYHKAPLRLLQGEMIDEEEQAEHHADPSPRGTAPLPPRGGRGFSCQSPRRQSEPHPRRLLQHRAADRLVGGLRPVPPAIRLHRRAGG